MNSRAILLAFLLAVPGVHGWAQKVKYKDLFVLLNNHQFEDAEPFLKKYLKENDDNPNADLFMGLILQEKAEKMDPLKQTEKVTACLDSAVLFYQRAAKGITEKEVSKNEDYYQMYNRRDIRTGKFGVKLSDVQLDIENRIKLKDRVRSIQTMKSHLVQSERFYGKTLSAYADIQKAFPTLGDLYLRGDEKAMASLKHLEVLHDSVAYFYAEYAALRATLMKGGKDIQWIPLSDFTRKDLTAPDFYQPDVKLWDFKGWATEVTEVIDKEITPMKNTLVAVDVEINKVHQHLKRDSVDVSDDIKLLRPKMSFPALVRIDPHPLPLQVFEMKIAELAYGSQVVADRHIRDSASLLLQSQAAHRQAMKAHVLDSVSALLMEGSHEDEYRNYAHFIEAGYGTLDVLKALIRSTHEYALSQFRSKEAQWKRKEAALRWMLTETDSIPLFTEPANGKFKPLVVTDKLTAGLTWADTVATGYFTHVTPSHRAKSKVTFQPYKGMSKRMVPFTKALTAEGPGGLAFVLIYAESKLGEKYPASLVRLQRETGMAWEVQAEMDFLPQEIYYNSDTDELSVKTKNASGELFPVIFDKAGKLVK